MLSCASVFDLTVAKEIILNSRLAHTGHLLANKAYCDSGLAELLQHKYRLTVGTPRKRMLEDLLRSSDIYFSTVGSILQRIESFVHWLNMRFYMQNASYICSTTRLLFCVFSAIIATTLLTLDSRYNISLY